MTQKLRTLKKRVVTEGAAAAGAVTLLLGIAFYTQGEIERQTQRQQALRSDIHSIEQQIADLERKHGIVNRSIVEFHRLKNRQKRGAFTIDRDQATDIFDTLRRKYRISNLSMTVTPKDVMAGADLVRPTGQIMFSEATLEFDAMSDLHVFSFVQDAADTLPGFLKITDFDISRQRQITNDVYVSVSRGEQPRMVSAKVRFLWLGIDEKPKVADAAQ